MVADGHYTAVLDRFEDVQKDDGEDDDESDSDSDSDGDRVAVFLLEGDDGVVAEKILFASHLPEEARQQNAVCDLRVEDDCVVSIEYDPEETDRRVSSAQSRFDRLARRPDDDE